MLKYIYVCYLTVISPPSYVGCYNKFQNFLPISYLSTADIVAKIFLSVHKCNFHSFAQKSCWLLITPLKVKVKVVKIVYQMVSQSAPAVLSIWVFLKHTRQVAASDLVSLIFNVPVSLTLKYRHGSLLTSITSSLNIICSVINMLFILLRN